MRTLLAAFVALLLASAAGAAGPDFPRLTGRVVDQSGLLSAAQRERLDSLLSAHEQRTTNQVVVVTLRSLQGLPIEDYGYRLGRHWGIGQKEKDNGALLIVAPQERKVRIEVGYGLEGQLTDALSRTIIERAIVPRFRQGDMAGGIVAGAEAIVSALEGREVALPERRQRESAEPDFSSGIVNAIFFGMVFLVVVLSLGGWGRRTRGRRGHYLGGVYPCGGYRGGGFGGGGFSGGGGGFGGGGASGGW